MFRRSANAGDTPNSRHQPLPVRIAGFAIFISAALLLLGGAYRNEADVIRPGLLLLALGVVLVPAVVRQSLLLKAAFCVLAIIGVFYALTT
jgi:uncharacterized membrane protein